MAEPDRMRGAIPIPDIGDGLVLRYLTADRQELRTTYGKDWVLKVEEGLTQGYLDEEILLKMMQLGLKKSDGTRVQVEDLDTLGAPHADLAARIMDAICMGAFGRTVEEQAKWMTEQIAKVTSQSPLDGPVSS